MCGECPAHALDSCFLASVFRASHAPNVCFRHLHHPVCSFGKVQRFTLVLVLSHKRIRKRYQKDSEEITETMAMQVWEARWSTAKPGECSRCCMSVGPGQAAHMAPRAAKPPASRWLSSLRNREAQCTSPWGFSIFISIQFYFYSVFNYIHFLFLLMFNAIIISNPFLLRIDRPCSHTLHSCQKPKSNELLPFVLHEV